MIRKLVVILCIGAGLSACASGKVQTTQQAYSPAQFLVTDVTVDIEAQSDRAFVGLTRSAAENLRQAYNQEMVSSVGSYTLELSVQDISVTDGQDTLEPITNNSLSLIATVRHPETGVAMRTYPVKYQLVRENKIGTKEEQLLRGALPAAFNGVYGLPITPEAIQPIVKSNQIFDGLDVKPVIVEQAPNTVSQPVAAPQSVPSADVSTTSQDSGEPTVIGCAIC